MRLSPHLLSLWGQCRLCRRALCPLRSRPAGGRCANGRRSSRASRTNHGDVDQNAPGRVLAARRLAAAAARRTSSARSTAIGRRPSGRSATRFDAKAPGEGRRALRRRGSAGDAGLGPRADDDPRLSDARPSACQSRSARPRAAARTTKSCIRRSMDSPRPTIDRPDLPRPCARARIRHAAPDARRSCSRTYCQTHRLRIHAHLRSEQKAGSRSASKAPARRSASPARASARSSTSSIEAEGFEKFSDLKFTGTKRFGLDGGECDDSGAGADHQARRRPRREGDRARHGPSRPAQRARASAGASRTAPSSMNSRAARHRRTTSRARAT